MEFELWVRSQYAAAGMDELEKRRSEIMAELRNGESKFSTEDLRGEVEMCSDEIERRNLEVQTRNLAIAEVQGGAGRVIESFGGEMREEDPFDTAEYRNAFMEYVCRKRPMPEQYRSDDYTGTGDAPVMIPTTLMKKIIEELEEYGEIYNAVTKVNVKGGVEYPIIDLKPEAYWVEEDEVSEYQKLSADDKIVFSYHEIECRLARSWLATITTFEEFTNRFVPAATEAMVKKIEATIVTTGDGNGKPLAITKDPRVTKRASLTPSEVVNWKKWRKNVKAKIKRPYRNGEYVMSQNTWDTYIECFSDDDNAPVSIGYNPVTGEEIKRLMGCEVLICDALPDYDECEDGECFCIYGKMRDYIINWNQTMQVYQWRDNDTRKDKTLAYAVLDGKVGDPYGFMLVVKESEDTLNLVGAVETSARYGVDPSALQTIELDEFGRVKGLSKYYDGSGWSAGTWDDSDKAGNFVALNFTADSGSTLKFKMVGGIYDGREVESASNSDYAVIKLTDPMNQRLIVTATKDTATQTETFTFEGVVCEA